MALHWAYNAEIAEKLNKHGSNIHAVDQVSV